MTAKPYCLLAISTLALAACAPQAAHIASASAPREKPDWAFEASDVPIDPAYRFGRLANGMRYVIRQNATPKGTAMVRLEVHAGSLDEGEAERGFAHFVEHMAFNGSTHVPEGEMVRVLERSGLAFGADTNAQTGFEQTTYMLDLPNTAPALLDTALMLMRETAGELNFAPEAIERERGVVLAEMRDRNSWQFRNLEDQLAFISPGALYAKRLPIGTAAALNAATAQSLKAFWAREYVPGNATLVVIGDLDPAQVEGAITAKFADWKPAPAQPQPDAGPVLFADKARTEIYLDPAMSERVTASRNGPYQDEPDSLTVRREHLLRQIGYAVVNRRLQSQARVTDPPFRGAGFGTGDVFKAGRTTNLIVDTVDRKWQRGLIAAGQEYRRAMAFGFTHAEVAEQIANIRTAAQNAASSADTQHNGALVNAVLALLRDDQVPVTPQSSLARLEQFIPQITPKAVMAALRREAVPLADPLLRFQGRSAPDGGEAAIRSAWNQAMRGALVHDKSDDSGTFGYVNFGTPGAITSDTRDPALGIRELRFANGVRLNIKHTDLEKDRITVQLSLDGGSMLATREKPLATEMAPMLPVGGLGKHSQDQLQSILAGHTVGAGLSVTPETFVSSAQTTPRDLELQLQLLTAFLSDPGYRPEGEVQYRLNINNFFAQKDATPGTALGNAIGGILSDNDPRFTLQKPDDYRKLGFAGLKADLADRLARGAIEIGIVGDVDEEQAIALVSRTLGALPAREADFGAYESQRSRPFTLDRAPRVIRHTGPKDQAVIRLTWPTRDDSDPVEALKLGLLDRIVQIEITETLREKLGKAYSPDATSDLSRAWKGYGTFSITASVETGEVPATRAAIAQVLAELRDRPVSADIVQRARQPMLESYDNALKTNRGWMALVDRAQTEADHIARFQLAKQRLLAITVADVQAMVRRYLTEGGAVEITVLPEGVNPPS